MVQWIIAEVMADHEVDPQAVVARFRRHSVFGWGTFKCTECRISWSSQITWVTLDIKEQRIRRRFKQKCKKCGQPQRPWWHVEEFAYMMEFALERYQKLVSGTWKPTNRPLVKSIDAPHKSELCERCGFGTRKCWLIFGDDKKDDEANDTADMSKLNGDEDKPKSESLPPDDVIEAKEDAVNESLPADDSMEAKEDAVNESLPADDSMEAKEDAVNESLPTDNDGSEIKENSVHENLPTDDVIEVNEDVLTESCILPEREECETDVKAEAVENIAANEE